MRGRRQDLHVHEFFQFHDQCRGHLRGWISHTIQFRRDQYDSLFAHIHHGHNATLSVGMDRRPDH